MWSWGESNPRPLSGCRLRYDHSRLALCGLRAFGSATPGGSAGSFSGVSGLSRRQRSFPAVLLCFCCQAAADWPRVPPGGGSQSPQRPTLRSGGEEHGFIIAVSIGAPFLESEQLRSRSTVSGLNVETDQPLVNVRYVSLYRTPVTMLRKGRRHPYERAWGHIAASDCDNALERVAAPRPDTSRGRGDRRERRGAGKGGKLPRPDTSEPLPVLISCRFGEGAAGL